VIADESLSVEDVQNVVDDLSRPLQRVTVLEYPIVRWREHQVMLFDRDAAESGTEFAGGHVNLGDVEWCQVDNPRLPALSTRCLLARPPDLHDLSARRATVRDRLSAIVVGWLPEAG